jgi:hypothetical protein
MTETGKKGQFGYVVDRLTEKEEVLGGLARKLRLCDQLSRLNVLTSDEPMGYRRNRSLYQANIKLRGLKCGNLTFFSILLLLAKSIGLDE